MQRIFFFTAFICAVASSGCSGTGTIAPGRLGGNAASDTSAFQPDDFTQPAVIKPVRLPNELLAHDNELYGTTSQGGTFQKGVVFEVSTSGGGRTIYTIQNASQAVTGLTLLNGELYGSARKGGAYNAGVIFGLNLFSHERNYTFSFRGGCDVENPSTRLVDYKGMLYGTGNGGTSGNGTVYAFDPVSRTEKVL